SSSWPNTANTTITAKATSTAWRAARLRCWRVIAEVSARKIGTVPGGSMMTNSVTKAEISSCQSSTSTRSPPHPQRGSVPRRAPRQDRASAHHREPTEVLDALEHLGRGGVLPQRVLPARAVVVRATCVEQLVPGGYRAQPLALLRAVVAVVDLEALEPRGDHRVDHCFSHDPSPPIGTLVREHRDPSRVPDEH